MRDFILLFTAIIALVYTINCYIETNASEMKLENSIKVDDKTFFDTPVMTSLNNQKEIISFNQYDINVTKKYEYEISGRVTKSFNSTFGIGGVEIPCRGICIVWNDLVTDENMSKIKFTKTLADLTRWQVLDTNWLKQRGGIDNISKNISFNYAMTNDIETRALLEKVSEGDFIKIKGYLVNMRYNGSERSSSTKLDDNYIEYILVEDIKWIE